MPREASQCGPDRYGNTTLLASVGSTCTVEAFIDNTAFPIGGGRCKLVASLVLRMACMSFHPYEFHAVRSLRGQQPLPQIDVFYRFLLRILPSAPEPSVHPMLVEGVHHVLRIRLERNLARRFEDLEGRNGAQ